MRRFRRWLAALLAAAASLSCAQALPAQTPFAELRIDAADMDIPERNISVNLYHRDEAGQFQPGGVRKYSCKLNRTTRDASFFIQTSADGVWLSVDYLTDVNGDGVYELLEDEASPVWDVMDSYSILAIPEGPPPTLEAGTTYLLSPETLIQRGQQAVQSRLAGGSCALDVGQAAPARQESPLCMVRLHRTDPADGMDYEQTYYLQISDNLRMPADVSPEDGCYDAVNFVLSRGYFSGASNGLFLPDSQLTRAQLAQVLWAVSGYPEAPASPFSDVSSDSWFCQAVSWCRQEGLISGYSEDFFAPDSPLSREQLVTIFYRWAQRGGVSLRAGVELSQFQDGEDTASWAVESMRWAVTHGLISVEDGALRPAAVVTRAELASALYVYAMNFETYNDSISNGLR